MSESKLTYTIPLIIVFALLLFVPVAVCGFKLSVDVAIIDVKMYVYLVENNNESIPFIAVEYFNASRAALNVWSWFYFTPARAVVSSNLNDCGLTGDVELSVTFNGETYSDAFSFNGAGWINATFIVNPTKLSGCTVKVKIKFSFEGSPLTSSEFSRKFNF